jgi:hypothetical protein
MNRLLDAAGTLLALLGLLVCAAAMLTRLSGSYYLAGVELTPLLTAGIALLLMAALAKLQLLVNRLG